MFKKVALAGALAASAFVALPAHAATITYLTDDGMDGDPVITLVPGGNSATGGFSFQVNDDGTDTFTATYTFTNPFDPAAGRASLTFVTDGVGDLEFTGASINGGATSLLLNNEPGFPGSIVFVANSPLAAGPGTLTFSGRLLNGAVSDTASGTLVLTAVPEPGTWALFILGFGGIGFAMRRRNEQVRSVKASLNFA